jgi:hypothetical protein
VLGDLPTALTAELGCAAATVVWPRRLVAGGHEAGLCENLRLPQSAGTVIAAALDYEGMVTPGGVTVCKM